MKNIVKILETRCPIYNIYKFKTKSMRYKQLHKEQKHKLQRWKD